MSESAVKKTGGNISLDWWSVILALFAAALVKTGVLPQIPW
jgi:hypothetical protein